MKRFNKKTLHLKKETVRQLQPSTLQTVAGGTVIETYASVCNCASFQICPPSCKPCGTLSRLCPTTAIC
jgi:hypothetical protein